MSITATSSSNYMSDTYIEAWMETKTDALYGDMSQSMSSSDHRAAAEMELNKIKAMIIDAKGKDGNEVRNEVLTALAEYGDVQEVSDALQPISNKLQSLYETAADANYTPGVAQGGVITAPPSGSHDSDPTFNIDPSDSDSWSSAVGSVVDGLSKQDAMSIINIQELNSQINQAKQIASALIDSADKSANAIISHIG